MRGFTNVDPGKLFSINDNQTRGNGCKLDLKRYNTNVCGNFYSYKICNTWNRLPAEVIGSETVVEFKRRLDRIIYSLGE